MIGRILDVAVPVMLVAVSLLDRTFLSGITVGVVIAYAVVCLAEHRKANR